MSRPRKPYGPNPPGRLQGTMVKVLAAELSDQGRLVRGKRYWTDDAVVDIVVAQGTVTAEVQGGRSQPYVVTLDAATGTGLPTKRDLQVRCTCPDDAGGGRDACKHAVAALFALSDEISIEPGLVERWRSGGHDAPDGVVTPLPAAGPDGRPPGDAVIGDVELAPVVPIRREPDDLSLLLRAPEGRVELPEPEPIVHPPLRGASVDRVPGDLLDGVLDDALDHLQIRWE